MAHRTVNTVHNAQRNKRSLSTRLTGLISHSFNLHSAEYNTPVSSSNWINLLVIAIHRYQRHQERRIPYDFTNTPRQSHTHRSTKQIHKLYLISFYQAFRPEIVLNEYCKMANEPEMDVLDGTSAADGVKTPNDSGETRTMMEVTYQKNPNQKYKFLEAEPKILGVTEIMLTAFFIGWKFLVHPHSGIIILALFSSVGIIAGSVAIAAQKLHIPTLKACLGMQIVTCVAGALWFFEAPFQNNAEIRNRTCTQYYMNASEESPNARNKNLCLTLVDGLQHLILIDGVMEAVQIAISVTLAAYCCKVIQSCSPGSHVPVITVKSTAPQ